MTELEKAARQEPFAWADLNALTEQFNSVNCGTAYRLPGEGRQPLYTRPQAREPLTIGEETTAFKAWFDAWWVGDGELCKAVTTEVEQSNSYRSLYTLAFGAWMAAKEAAHGISDNAP